MCIICHEQQQQQQQPRYHWDGDDCGTDGRTDGRQLTLVAMPAGEPVNTLYSSVQSASFLGDCHGM